MRWAARAFGHDLHDPRARTLFQEVCGALERQPKELMSAGSIAPSTPSATATPTGKPRARKAPGEMPRVTLGIATFNRETYLA
jgi:hypothetical protein